MVVVALSRGSTIHQQVIKEFSWSFCLVRCTSYKVRWMIRRSSQSKIMMGPTGLGHKVSTKLVQVKGNILESGRLVWVRTDSGLSGFGPNWIRVKSKYFKKWWFK
ncbi:hypothetical protein HanPI659440_Chr01g0013551 [Helianthus annuus]|nr:hypothetical protein HanPI659440_Chr01g0013551 [Helianthus annuus]